ncbi:MAG: oxygen-independent coproporphyrinogen III oxidase [Sulfitobacter sp.]|nr:oxygen-independent coproporphyrinogen III oxidase [Sulfitobacter sp.]
MNNDQLRALGFFDARIPRYTSYPPATVFSHSFGAPFQSDCITSLDPAEPVSVYVHIPFCERLCWFCACRTQGTKTLQSVENYIDTVIDELKMIAGLLPEGVTMGRLHWGGGTPTILPPAAIARLAAAIYAAFPKAEDFEFSVEIDPTMVDQPKIDALAAASMSRASIGIQDFAEDVQKAIGREQSFAATKACVDMLRKAGIHSLNTDLVYGLPHQTLDKISASIDNVIALDPDRVALFGYAHVPHMSKRQRLIDVDTLPGDEARFALSELATRRFVEAGLSPIGIDHFAKPQDTLAIAERTGHLRRNFQGYTVDTCETLIGIGASSISQFKEGFMQNASATSAYTQRIRSGTLAGFRGHRHSADDLLRKRVVESIMCYFRLDLSALRQEFGSLADTLAADHRAVAERFGSAVDWRSEVLSIPSNGRQLARLVANMYDHSTVASGQYSKAS